MQLFDSGYDLWFGNNRGTKFSRRVASAGLLLSEAEIESNEFYDWSTEDLAKYDLPAEIEMVLQISA